MVTGCWHVGCIAVWLGACMSCAVRVHTEDSEAMQDIDIETHTVQSLEALLLLEGKGGVET